MLFEKLFACCVDGHSKGYSRSALMLIHFLKIPSGQWHCSFKVMHLWVTQFSNANLKEGFLACSDNLLTNYFFPFLGMAKLQSSHFYKFYVMCHGFIVIFYHFKYHMIALSDSKFAICLRVFVDQFT